MDLAENFSRTWICRDFRYNLQFGKAMHLQIMPDAGLHHSSLNGVRQNKIEGVTGKRAGWVCVPSKIWLKVVNGTNFPGHNHKNNNNQLENGKRRLLLHTALKCRDILANNRNDRNDQTGLVNKCTLLINENLRRRNTDNFD